MNGKSVLITGCSRGLGLGFCEKFLNEGWRVFAGARAPKESKGLMSLKEKYPDDLILFSIDMISEKSICDAYQTVSQETNSLDVLINNAGRYGKRESELEKLDLEDTVLTFQTNALGPIRVIRTFLSLIRKGKEKKIISITSKMGSIQDNQEGGSYSYRISKAALNMIGKTMALEFQNEGITSIVLHPGWVKTDMGGSNAPIDISTSINGMFNVITSLTQKQNGSFLRHDGTRIPF